MGAYLIDHPPVRDQWYDKRNRPLTGCTVLHTAEGVLDTIGPDTGAEATAEFIRTRTTAGSYHDLVDADSWVPLIPYQHGAFHDGTGSNNWALSLSFACRTSDWRAMTPEKRRGFLRQGARAFAAQQAWRKANGFPMTELRLITKAQSDAGMSGFTYHGFRDPGRRTDPGVAPPNLFPFDEFIAECRAALAGHNLEDDMYEDADRNMLRRLVADPGPGYGPDRLREIYNLQRATAAQFAGLTAAVNKLADLVASGHDDLDAAQIIDQIDERVQEGIQRAGEELRAVEEAAKASAGPAA